MSTEKNPRSIRVSLLCATALMIAGAPVIAQRPTGQDTQRPAQDAPPPPPPTRPQTPPPAPPPPPQDARAQQQREQAARDQQQREQNARAQQQQEQQRQDQQRIEKARQEQNTRDQERIAKARQDAANADPKTRDTINRLIAAEHVHREQLARINRLKFIAERQGQKERLGDLDRLLAESNTNFDHKLQAAKTEIPEPQYTSTVQMLESGRRREVRSMIGSTGGTGGDSGGQPVDAGKVQRAPPAQPAPQRTPPPERPKDSSQPPH
jgi:flagellar biosynthesis GTPase FlhF